MLVITYVVSRAYDLPFRDADGILGGRIVLLLGTIGLFMAIDVVPRAIRRRGWRWSELRTGVPELVRERWSWRRLTIVLLGIVAFYMTYLAYRNLKSFLPLITSQDLDMNLLTFEQDVLGGTHPFDVLHTLLGTGISAQVLSTVYLFFLAFVPISLGASLIVSINPLPGLWWVLTLGINWTLGTLSYYLVPTMGPWFIAPQLFGDLPVTGVSRLQNALWVERLEVINDPTVTNAVQSVAGFASLHASITFSAALIAHLLGLARIVRIALWTFFGLTMLATVYFGWHYVLDDIAGLLIGGIAVVVGALLTGNRDALRRRPREEATTLSAQGFAIPDAASVWRQVPNVLTVFRIALVPLLVLAIAEDPDGSALAVAIFVLAAMTDVADGRIARRQEVVSTFGKLADPIADKLLIGGALVALAVSDQVATWIVVVVLGRELAVTLLRWHAKREGIIVPASIWGKAKMVLQCAALVALLAVPGAAWVNALLYVTVAATVVSGIDYALHLRQRADP